MIMTSPTSSISSNDSSAYLANIYDTAQLLQTPTCTPLAVVPQYTSPWSGGFNYQIPNIFSVGYSPLYSMYSHSLYPQTSSSAKRVDTPPPTLEKMVEMEPTQYKTPTASSMPRSPDSGVSTLSSASSSGALSELHTPSTRLTNQRRKNYCAVCQVQIDRPGVRSQGPRRHILQYHVKQPLYQCIHCSHSSVYDKHHVINHMKRIHKDNSGLVHIRLIEFEAEIDDWIRKCFPASKSLKRARDQTITNTPPTSSGTPPPCLYAELPNPAPSTTVTSSVPFLTPETTPPHKRRAFTIDNILA